MNYYIATSTERIFVHNQVRDDLKKLGLEITYDWTTNGNIRSTSKKCLQEAAFQMHRGILKSDFVLVLLPGGKGTHTEIGLSIASSKRVFLHSEDPMAFELGPQICAFYHHPDAVRFVCPIDQVAKTLWPFLEETLQRF